MRCAIKQGEHRTLWNVINVTLSSLAPLIFQLGLYEHLGHDKIVDPVEIDLPIPPEMRKQVAGWLELAAKIADDFEASSAKDRISNFQKELKKISMTWRTLGFQSKVLREAFAGDLNGQLIYRYTDDRAKLFGKWKDDWIRVTDKFPSVSDDAKASVDCWALGYSTASVFHSMRILEYGLAALASDVGVEIGVNSWQTVIDQIESRIKEIWKTLPRGTKKTERLQFLSGAAKELTYFKDGWRNHVSHNRATYDEHQARSVMEHVRGFMTAISCQLSEVQLPS